MKISFNIPSEKLIQSYLSYSYSAAFNYNTIKATASDKPAENHDNDHSSIGLGNHSEVFEKAKSVLKSWQHFPKPWTKIYDFNSSINEDNVVIVSFKIFGLWWINSAKIVYTFEEDNRFGFAYGTLNGHTESGEEVFYLQRAADGQIYYHIKAFSKPAYWFVRLTYPVARYYQRKFVTESLAQVKAMVNV